MITAKNKAKGLLLNAQSLHQGHAAKSEAIKQAEAIRYLAPLHLHKYWDEVIVELLKINI